MDVNNDLKPEPMYSGALITSIETYPSARQTGLRLLMHVVWRRRWTGISVLMSILAVTMIWTLKQTRIYRSTVTIQIGSEDSNKPNDRDTESAREDEQRLQITILTARPLARLVIEDLGLQQSPEFAPTRSASDPLRNAIDTYLARLHVVSAGSVRLINVSFDATDPGLAAIIANAHAKHFIDQTMAGKSARAQRESQFLEPQLADLKAKFEQSQQNLDAYVRDNHINLTADGTIDSGDQRLIRLEEEYSKARADRIKEESDYQFAVSDAPDALDGSNSDALTALRGKLAELKRQESELALTETPEHPSRKSLLSQIAEIEKSVRAEKGKIIRSVQADYTAAKQREEALSAAVAQEQKLAKETGGKIVQYGVLKREVDSGRESYQGLLNRVKENGISAAIQSSGIRVVEPAEVPAAPIRPRNIVNMTLALIAGLIAGVLAALLHEALKAPSMRAWSRP